MADQRVLTMLLLTASPVVVMRFDKRYVYKSIVGIPFAPVFLGTLCMPRGVYTSGSNVRHRRFDGMEKFVCC